MSIPIITRAEAEPLLDWRELSDAIAAGHRRPRAELGDTFLFREPDTLLSRSAWIDGLGIAVKTATIFPENPKQGAASINGAVCLFDDQVGTLAALIDFHLVTKWKTAGDSLLAALQLANPDSRDIVIVGAGTVAASLCEAFAVGFPEARIRIWNRARDRAEALAGKAGCEVADELAGAVNAADIVLSATMSREPVIRGEWLRPGQHVNLIGAFRPDMREADDTALRRSRIFADSFSTTVDHIGEFLIPLTDGVIGHDELIADFYDLSRFTAAPQDITLFKNGGGAHLDLMTSRYILDKWRMAQ